MPRTQLDTECRVFTFCKGNARSRYRHLADTSKTSVCTHKLLLLPSPNSRGDKTAITLFSSVSIQKLSSNESSIMINFQKNLYEEIQKKSYPMAAEGQ